MTQADEILDSVYDTLAILALSDSDKYARINEIVDELASRNAVTPISPKTMGTISERLCELALRSAVPTSYKRITNEWNWMADFSIAGHPFNPLVSVKSFKAKERLLVSGSGNNLSPCVGWGLFDDPAEWSEDRVRKYLFRSFMAIYLPSTLIAQLSQQSREIRNLNGRLFLRDVGQFIDDISVALDNDGLIKISEF